MDYNKEVISDLKEKYEKAKKLSEETSQYDSINEPYKSKYAALEIFQSMKERIDELFKTDLNNFEQKLLNSILALVYLNIGMISVETEESTKGEQVLLSCLECFNEDNYIHPAYILIYLNALNNLGLIDSGETNIHLALKYLKKAQSIYLKFKKTNQIAREMIDIFEMEDQSKNDATLNLETTHTLTLFYLVQIYSKLNQLKKSAIYCHITLKRQLKFKQYEPIDWALNTATLSQYFMKHKAFFEARHHLAAASYTLDEYEKNGQVTNEDQFKYRKADIARCWSKYGLNLLNYSKNRLMDDKDDSECESEEWDISKNLCKEEDPSTSDEEILNNLTIENEETLPLVKSQKLKFPTLNLKEYEEQITTNPVLDYDDARKVFINAQKWLNEAKNYYTLEDRASDYVEVVKDISNLYKALIFFESDPSRQCKMLKRRVDNLKPVVEQLNPKYYQNECEEINIELATIYKDMLEIKLEEFNKDKSKASPHMVEKINTLARNSIEFYKKYTDLILNENHQLKNRIFNDVEVEKSVLTAYFHIAALYDKIIELDKEKKLVNLQNCLNYYKMIVEYCEKYPEVGELIKNILEISQSLSDLLPIKMSKLFP